MTQSEPLALDVTLPLTSARPCSEHSAEAFAWHATDAYLMLDGHDLDHLPRAAVALARDTAPGTLGVPRTARRPREWSVP
ncbi:hypothetical protein [Streptomyces hygroscopicus]|uniref:hypothetical protein n=1 Tax=Streptomyces sp. KHY 26 TaxID=3097359 RepID=UPI0025541926|nr:hypothetical protein [Streptomyces hygroscopicus]